MTFTEFIKLLTREQVETWWNSISNYESMEEEIEPEWKYKLSKDGKQLPFKWVVRELAKHYELPSVDFSSNDSTRDRFCEAFDFSIIEELRYDNSEIQRLSDFYSTLNNKPLFKAFIDYTHSVVVNSEIEPYKIRMAIRPIMPWWLLGCVLHFIISKIPAKV